MFHLALIFYPHHTGMRSQILYTNRSFDLPRANACELASKTRLKQVAYLLPEKIFMLKQKSSNIHMICSNSVKKLLSNYLCTLHWRVFTNGLHWRVIWNLPRANVCEAASNTRLNGLGQFGSAVSAMVVANVLCEKNVGFWNTLKAGLQRMFAS